MRLGYEKKGDASRVFAKMSGTGRQSPSFLSTPAHATTHSPSSSHFNFRFLSWGWVGLGWVVFYLDCLFALSESPVIHLLFNDHPPAIN